MMLPALLLALSVDVSYADEYSQGLKAYLEKDYVQAQWLWLKAAEKGHAKAMFNLGLLHQSNQIPNSQADKANKWFLLSGKHGYAAAYYHYAAYLEANGESDKAQALYQRAAGAGYPPAIAKSTGVVVRADKAPAPTVKKASNAPTKAPVKTARDTKVEYLSTNWIQSKHAQDWTIQLLAFKDETKVKAFIDQHRLNSRAAYFVEPNPQGVLYKLIIGAYSNREQADAAKQALPKNLSTYGPWLRTFGSIQQGIAQR